MILYRQAQTGPQRFKREENKEYAPAIALYSTDSSFQKPLPALYGNGVFPALHSTARLAPPHVSLQINPVSGRAPQAEPGRLRTARHSPGGGSGRSTGPTSPPQRQAPGPTASGEPGRWGSGPAALRAGGEKARGLPGSSGRPCPLRARLGCSRRLLLAPGQAMRSGSVGGSPAARARPALPPAPLSHRHRHRHGPSRIPGLPRALRGYPGGCRAAVCPALSENNSTKARHISWSSFLTHPHRRLFLSLSLLFVHLGWGFWWDFVVGFFFSFLFFFPFFFL